MPRVCRGAGAHHGLHEAAGPQLPVLYAKPGRPQHHHIQLLTLGLPHVGMATNTIFKAFPQVLGLEHDLNIVRPIYMPEKL